MHIAGAAGDLHLGYCTNIHAGETLAEIVDGIVGHLPPIKAQVCPDAAIGIGLRLSALAARDLAAPGALAEFRDRIAALGAYVFTVNAFPYGPFHGVPVKARVYEPDWREPERRRFTREAAWILAGLLPDGLEGSVSTVPGAFRPVGRIEGALDRMGRNFLGAAADLVEIERRTGRRIVLALEPEPCCLLETTEEACVFLEEQCFGAEAVAAFAALTGLSRQAAEAALRRHLGLCYDVCHGAVEFEDPVASCRWIRAAGIALPKIQLSSALRVPAMTADLLSDLMRFDTGRYLHQVVVRNRSGLERHLDLPDAEAAFCDGGARGEWRIHCHVPVFHPGLGAIGSTQGDLVTLLAAARDGDLSPHLEVETYTWDILPEALRLDDKAASIARELDFVLREIRQCS